MPDDTHVIRGINWRETFPFTHIFRSFRVAIHPSKLILALVAIVLLYIGGRVLDGIWPTSSKGVAGEIEVYESVRANRLISNGPGGEGMTRAERAALTGSLNFSKLRDEARARIEAEYAEALIAHKVQIDGKPITADQAREAALGAKHDGLLKDRIVAERDAAVQRLRERDKYERDAADAGTLPAVHDALNRYFAAMDFPKDQNAKDVAKAALDKAIKDAATAQEAKEKDLKPEQKETEAARKLADRKSERAGFETSIRETFDTAETQWRTASRINGAGLWMLFMNYETDRVNDVVRGVMHNNWFGGFTGSVPAANPLTGMFESGVFDSIYRFFCVAPRWAIGQHGIYFTLFGILFLIVWAIFGGAIARIAAVHVAREEKLSIRQAIRFSSGKFLSFAFAPVIPLVIVLVVGLVVALGGLLLYIPFVGEILVGIFFFLALAAGFVMTLVALGTAGGLNLMYPTIAVEGSDSFDAISRSFSYVYARPWRMLWYTVVAIVYGAFTFLFVRLFVYLTLAFAHKFTGLWVGRSTAGEQPVWGSIWPGSGLWHMPYEIPYLSLSPGQSIAAFFVAMWVFLTISFLGAFLISYYFSSSTVIYYLMRREVDATELDDVYVEQSEDEFAEPTPATANHGTPTSIPVVLTTPVTPVDGTNPPVAG